jgi:hypothetical protein
MDRITQLRRDKERFRKIYITLFEEVSQILFKHDPIGINFESNTDEYEPEVGTILPRLKECYSAEEACRVIHQEFIRWFGGEIAGPEQMYEEIGKEVWEAWIRIRGET